MVRIKQATVLLCALLISIVCNAQECNLKLSGKVSDTLKQGVPGAVIRMANDTLGAVTDTSGQFSITGVCAGKYTITVEAIGFKKLSFTANINDDKEIKVSLSSNEHLLGEIVVSGEKVPVKDLHTITSVELKGIALLETRGQSLGEALKQLPGLNSVQTGPTLWKPVIHGLHSNRVLIMNNGVRQEGQQWGSEHAPEIDPFVANKITVVKGAAGVRYGSDAIGGVVLLSPDELPSKPGISGDAYLIGASNGRMGAISTSLQGAFDKKLKGLAWRIQGTLKDAGNFQAPRYYLINTGLREGDFSANICYKWKRFDFDLFYSQYNTEVGIFIGAESGNVKELMQKFSQSTPGLPSYFTYNIARPYQIVNHELLRGVVSHKFDRGGSIELTLGRQNDRRREYDELSISKIADPKLPQLSFQLVTHTADLVFTQRAQNGFSGSLGITGNTSGNVFEGVRYLIPNFRDYNTGVFAIERYNFKKLTVEAGLRYDYRWLRVYQRNPSTLALYNTAYNYNNVTGTVGCTYRYDKYFSVSFNAGSAWRAPSINEMYIYGEHFSDASFQVGDSSLKSERSLNTGLSMVYASNKLRVITDLYYNRITNYIYDKPALAVRQLASGTFPEFDFTQANVNIRGLDVTIQYDALPQVTFQSKTTIVRGLNESINDWLISMPCDRFENGLEFHLPKLGFLHLPYLSAENVSAVRQTRVPPNSDFVPTPKGYALFNAHAGCTLPLGKKSMNVDFTVNNITNVSYREYLNHFRYYADELGINYTLRIKLSF